MLTDGRFWVGILAGAAAYHLYMVRKAKKANG